MRIASSSVLASVVLAVGMAAASAIAQGPATSPSAQPEPGFGVLQGRWVRPDGGYMIAIRSVAADGRLDAAYANPRPLPFAKAEASRDGRTIRVFLELRAGGYNGSTYSLTYDPASDTLRGVYFQAVAQQKFDVHFTRAR